MGSDFNGKIILFLTLLPIIVIITGFIKQRMRKLRNRRISEMRRKTFKIVKGDKAI